MCQNDVKRMQSASMNGVVLRREQDSQKRWPKQISFLEWPPRVYRNGFPNRIGVVGFGMMVCVTAWTSPVCLLIARMS